MKRTSFGNQTLFCMLFCCLFLQVFGGAHVNTPIDTSGTAIFGSRGVKAPYITRLARQKTEEIKGTSLKVKSATFLDYYNWSGWMAGSGSGNGFKSVQGNWNVQCFSGPQSNTIQESSWIGLGGNFSGDGLVQTGTEKDPNGNVYLFWEAFNSNGSGPNNGLPTSNHVNIPCGHAIHAVVMYHPGGCSNGFTTQVQDITGGTSYNSGCLNLTGGHESAEWIDERPDCGTGPHFTSLADFNYTSWSNVLTQINTSNSGWATPLNYSPTQLTMQDSLPGGTGSDLASPDGITINSNNTFTNRWYAYGNYYGSCSGV